MKEFETLYIDDGTNLNSKYVIAQYKNGTHIKYTEFIDIEGSVADAIKALNKRLEIDPEAMLELVRESYSDSYNVYVSGFRLMDEKEKKEYVKRKLINAKRKQEESEVREKAEREQFERLKEKFDATNERRGLRDERSR